MPVGQLVVGGDAGEGVPRLYDEFRLLRGCWGESGGVGGHRESPPGLQLVLAAVEEVAVEGGDFVVAQRISEVAFGDRPQRVVALHEVGRPRGRWPCRDRWAGRRRDA